MKNEFSEPCKLVVVENCTWDAAALAALAAEDDSELAVHCLPADSCKSMQELRHKIAITVNLIENEELQHGMMAYGSRDYIFAINL